MKHSEICRAERCGFISLPPTGRVLIAVLGKDESSRCLPSFRWRQRFREDPCPPRNAAGKRYAAALKAAPLRSRLRALVLLLGRLPLATFGGPQSNRGDRLGSDQSAR